MDVKAPPDLYARLAGHEVDADAICESIRVVAEGGFPHEFRTTFVPQLLTKTDLAEIRALVPQGSPWRIQPFRAEHALDPRLRPTNGEKVEPANSRRGIPPGSRQAAMGFH
jgi:pyruvate-formate lyase-activating enzyme